ncbi:MAG: aryl-sulfate sulfotransferase, partial [Myxococcota bacterium]|nr:aryl-sulfate sulfotransferase [Myxococcota bacterium]
RAILSSDGQHVLYNALPEESQDNSGRIVKVALDGSSTTEVSFPGLSMDFVELPDGTITVIAHDKREVDGLPVVGDRLVEYGPDGSEVEIWTIWDHLEYEEPVNPDAGTTWTHSNALDYSPEDDVYRLSVRNFDTQLTIDRATGEVLEDVGGAGSDYTLTGDDAQWFHKAHQFDRRGDEMLVFANGFDVETGSQVLGYRLDTEAGEATMLWEYQAAFPLYCYTYGDVSWLPSGNVLVTWSTAGQLEEVTWSGEVVWQLKANLGAGFGYTTWMESLYPG